MPRDGYPRVPASPAVTDLAPEGPGEVPTPARTAGRAKAPLLPGAL
jgi:hypothetical protein